jgi:hypothetical protein
VTQWHEVRGGAHREFFVGRSQPAWRVAQAANFLRVSRLAAAPIVETAGASGNFLAKFEMYVFHEGLLESRTGTVQTSVTK